MGPKLAQRLEDGPEGVHWWVGLRRPRKLWAGVGQKRVERGADADVGEVEKLNSWSETNHGLTFAWLFPSDKGGFKFNKKLVAHLICVL